MNSDRSTAVRGFAVRAIVILVLLFCSPRSAHTQAGDLLVLAAASMQTVLDELTPQLERAAGSTVRVSYAATSTLARQLENGLPADVFISADLEWMDYVQERGLIRTDTRVTLVGNTLVLVAPAADRTSPLRIGPGFPLAARLGAGRLAVADPASVPAGKYARAALVSLGVWGSVESRLAPAENVRSALVLVSRGEAPFGVVYRSDALADPGVVIVDTFPASSHPPIVYPAALTRTARPNAGRILEVLQSAAARAVFERQGFLVARPPS